MSRHYTGMGRYEQLFDQLDAAISKLESRCDKIERRVTNLPASKATYAHQACYDSRREIHTFPTCWDPPSQTHGRRVEEIRAPPLPEPHPQYTPYTDMDFSYAPPRQYMTSNFGQPPYSSDEFLPKPYDGYHPGQHEYPPTPPPYRPLRSPTCWGLPEHVSPILLGCRLPQATESRRLSRPYLCHDPSSPSLPAVAAVPPPPPPRSSPYWSHCRSAASLLAAADVPPLNLTPPAQSCSPDGSGEEGQLLHDGPPPPAKILQEYNRDVSEEKETLLEDKEKDGSIGEVEKIITSFNVARVSSKDVENCRFKRAGACTGVRIIAYIYVDFFDGDVPSIVHRSTSLDADARFIPPRNDTPYLSILGGDRGIRSVVRYVFDPRGDALLKLLLSTLVNGSWFSWFPP